MARAAIIVEAGREVEEAHKFLQDNKAAPYEMGLCSLSGTGYTLRAY